MGAKPWPMQSKSHSISRGSERAERRTAEPKLSLVSRTKLAEAEPRPAPEQVLPDERRLTARLDALERLARLRSQDLLTAKEYASEKALLLGHSGEDQAIPQLRTVAAAAPGDIEQGRSLVGQMFSWKFLPIGAVAGIGLSFGIQPQETMRFFDQALRLVGA